MTKNEVVDLVLEYISTTQFPKKCNTCGRIFCSLKNYLENTTNIGMPVSYDAELGFWKPFKQLGTVAMANCGCGSTLSISSYLMPITTMWKLLVWLKHECKRRELPPSQILEEIRQLIDDKVLWGDETYNDHREIKQQN